MNAIEGGSEDLLARALICRDPALPGPSDTGGRYDLTLKFIEEYRTFPFGQWKDLIDATSRIYDMDPHAPVPMNRLNTEPNVYADGV